MNLKDLEPGDIVHYRCGGSGVVVEYFNYGNGLTPHRICVLDDFSYYYEDGLLLEKEKHPLDIISIEKKPTPVVRTLWAAWDDKPDEGILLPRLPCGAWGNILKITITNGEPSIERVK